MFLLEWWTPSPKQIFSVSPLTIEIWPLLLPFVQYAVWSLTCAPTSSVTNSNVCRGAGMNPLQLYGVFFTSMQMISLKKSCWCTFFFKRKIENRNWGNFQFPQLRWLQLQLYLSTPVFPNPYRFHRAANSFHFRNSCFSRKIFYFSKFITNKIPGKYDIATYMIFPYIPQRKRQSQPVHRIGTQRYQNQRTLCYKSPNGAKRR